jgi:hypothetical protein
LTGPVSPGFRCAQASLDAGDDLAGTASTLRSFLLVEAEGAWGVQALRAGLLPPAARDWLRGLESRHRVRPLLIRRSGRRPDGATAVSVFAAHTAPGHRFLEHRALDDLQRLPELDTAVARVGRGERPGWSPYDGSLFLTCTHGRHDACCAERGRPVWHAMQHAAPERSWQVSHIGGDRYAANVAVLPEGLYYGRLRPRDADRLIEAHRRGEVLLEHLRGRTAWPFPVQAAEIQLRRQTGELGEDRLHLVEARRDGPLTVARFALAGREWQVTIRTSRLPARRLTCSAAGPAGSLQHELVDLR